MSINTNSCDKPKNPQPSRKQFGAGLVEDIRERGDRRNVTFDTLRGELIIDGGDRVDINGLYQEFMAVERHKRSPIRQRFLIEWMKQVPSAQTDLATLVARNVQQQLSAQQLEEASSRRAQNPETAAEYDRDAALRRLLSENL